MRLEADVSLGSGEGELAARFRIDEPLCVVTGASGAGKTTLLHMIAGLRRPDRGVIRLNGATLFDSRAGIDLAPERRAIACVFQDDRLFPHMDVKANLLFGRDDHKSGEGSEDFNHVVDALDLGGLLCRRPASLSGGEKRRIALARALLQRPARLLLLDEPLTGLDPARREAALGLIERRRDQGATGVLFVTHQATEVQRLGGAHLRVGANDPGFALTQVRPNGGAVETSLSPWFATLTRGKDR